MWQVAEDDELNTSQSSRPGYCERAGDLLYQAVVKRSNLLGWSRRTQEPAKTGGRRVGFATGMNWNPSYDALT